jgi:glycosyltransferase involved in cell wall biosynthesis
MRISVVIPAHNEEGNIERTMGLSVQALRANGHEFELILIDDASTDRTGAIADALAAVNPEIRVIHNLHNLGQGASLVAGFRSATKDLVIHNGMDYPFDFHNLDRMLLLIEGADIVVAVRTGRAGYTLYRRILSVANVAMLNLLFGLGLRDYTFVQLYRREVLNAVNPEARSTGFLIPEILIRAHDMGFRIREVPIEYHPRLSGVATSGSVRVLWGSSRDMFRFWLKRHKREQ